MRNARIALCAAILCAASAAQATPTGLLYVDDTLGNVGTVNLATGAVSVIGNAGLLNDIAVTSDGKLYGTTATSLYSISATTAAKTLVGSYGLPVISAIGASGTTLYAASSLNTNLYSINTAKFGITPFNGSTSGLTGGDLAVAPGGTTVYETLATGQVGQITITGNSIMSTIVAALGGFVLQGLEVGSDGTIYAISGTEIYTVNNGALTPYLDYSGHGLLGASSTAYVAAPVVVTPAAVPEPGSILMLATGLFGLGLIGIGKRRRDRQSAAN